jgi:hypothetical protein
MVGSILTHRLGVAILPIPLSCVKPDDESGFTFVQQVLRLCAVRPPFHFFFIQRNHNLGKLLSAARPQGVFARTKKDNRSAAHARLSSTQIPYCTE